MLALREIFSKFQTFGISVAANRKCFIRTFLNDAGPELDVDYLCNPTFTDDIRTNIISRKGVGDIDKVLHLHSLLKSGSDTNKVKEELIEELLKIPNRSHPDVINYGTEPNIVELVGKKKDFCFDPQPFHQLAESIDGLRTNQLGLFCGSRSYYIKGFLANLEDALVKMTLDFLLKKKKFQLVGVPDLLPSQIISGCGMNLHGERNQVYKLNRHHYGDMCLSGTAEMSLAAMFANEVVDCELPLKLASASRCYRAEVSNIQEEKGIYRVHQFTKVEMFGLTNGDCNDSDQLLEEFVSIQKELFSSLGLHYKVLDMPLHELGAPAYRKFDIEAWMAGKQMYGEISSASNCTDYQSRRLGIRHEFATTNCHKSLRHVHTVNGTACAIPRMLIALFETHQKENGTVELPSILEPYLSKEVFGDIQRPRRKIKMGYVHQLPVIDYK
ncbi:hypothetical protein CHUAL_010461 [Chamberlinius hualienensis]